MGESAISISGDPTKKGPLVHTMRAVGTVTKAIDALKVGDEIGLRGPFGTAWPMKEIEGKDIAIVTGGIGLPPLRPAIYHILANREKYGRVALLYGARTPADLMYPKEVAAWRSRFDMDVQVSVDAPAEGWSGKVGVVTKLIAPAQLAPAKTVALVCGPEIMIHFAMLTLKDNGLDSRNIYVSMERNMKCAVGLCGHCQWGPTFICKDGPVFRYDQVESFFKVREL
jgi:NAD(P)H-flavin reductase